MASNHAASTIGSWNRATKHVENSLQANRYLMPETALLFAGPPRLADAAGLSQGVIGDILAADPLNSDLSAGEVSSEPFALIGSCENFTVQQAQNVTKIFEIGSRLPFQAGGRVQVVGSMSRVMFYGNSLMRVLYSYYPSLVNLAGGANANGITGTPKTPDQLKEDFPEIYYPPGTLVNGANGKKFGAYMNLMSEIFSHPFGLGCILRDHANHAYTGIYLEDSMITTHSFNVNSPGSMISEMVGFQANAAVPVDFG
jgi:hypothetical protein